MKKAFEEPIIHFMEISDECLTTDSGYTTFEDDPFSEF